MLLIWLFATEVEGWSEIGYKIIRLTEWRCEIMSDWTLGQWGAYAIVWLWGTWASGKVSNFLQRGFEARILAIHPYYKFPNRYSTIPAWLVGMVCAWIAPSDKDFLHFGPDWLAGVIAACLLSICHFSA